MRGVEALVLIVLAVSCSLDEFGAGSASEPLDASATGGVFTGGTGTGGFPEAAVGGIGGTLGGSGGVGATGGLAGSDSGTGGGIDGGGGVDSGTGGAGGTGGSPPWQPSDINNCVAWLDAADVTTMTLSGQNLTGWSSKCGSTSVTAAGAKTPETLLVGPDRVVRCNGVSHELTFTGTPVQASSYTLFFVMSKNFAAEQKAVWSNRALSVVSGVTKTFLGYYSETMFLYQDTASVAQLRATKPQVASSTRMFELAVNPNKRELVLDGTVEASDAATGTATLLAAGTLCTDKGANFAAYDIRELIMYDRELTPSERQKVRTELKTKWGL